MFGVLIGGLFRLVCKWHWIILFLCPPFTRESHIICSTKRTPYDGPVAQVAHCGSPGWQRSSTQGRFLLFLSFCSSSWKKQPREKISSTWNLTGVSKTLARQLLFLSMHFTPTTSNRDCKKQQLGYQGRCS